MPSLSSNPSSKPKLGVLACAVLEQELDAFAVDRPHLIAREVLEQGLHTDPDKLRSELQAAVTRMENDNPQIEAIVLLYGLCSRGIEGIVTERVPMVVARAHDCITLLLGSKERYAEYLEQNPGTYWYSPGWIATGTQPGKFRYEETYQEYLEKYGEDNAEYLMEMEQKWMTEYNRATYVDLGVTDPTQDIIFTKECAEWLKWGYDQQAGDRQLMADLLDGVWDNERFLILPPGQTAHLVPDARVMEARSVSKSS